MVRDATSTIPVVFLQVSDPVAQGFIASLTQPGGNLTGFSAYEFSIGGKWLDLLKEAAPGLARAAVMFNPDTSPQSKFFMRSVEAAARPSACRRLPLPFARPRDIEPAIANFARRTERRLDPADRQLHPLAPIAHCRLSRAAIACRRFSAAAGFAKDGGLMNYGVAVNTH